MEVSKKWLIIILMMLALASPAYARDYSLDSASAEVTVAGDGLVHVTESIDYSFTGTYREVFRRVYPPPEGSIQNIKIRCTPLPCESRVDTVTGGYELVGVLPTPTPEAITFIVSYDYLRGLKVYDDISELHYKIWGDEWDKALSKLTISVELPTDDGGQVRYWLHPGSFTKTSSLDGSRIFVETKSIPSHNWYEIRAVFPRLNNPDSGKVTVINRDGMQEILEVENNYIKKQARAENLYKVVWLLVFLALLMPYYIYHKYGREPEINYSGIYEREPPSESKPAAVNAIMRGSIGKPDLNAFIATIMDLVYQGFIELSEDQSETSYLGIFTRTKEDVTLKLAGSEEGLLDFESDVFNFLSAYASDGVLSWQKLKSELGKDDRFYKFINRWNKSIERQIRVERLFDSKGNHLLIGFSVLLLIVSFIAGIGIINVYPPNQFPQILNAVVPGLALFLIGIGSLAASLINEKGAGRFTVEGRLYHERWHGFRKYLTDYSMLKEHPPGSIKLWDYYLVYAVALGVADKVIKNMDLILPKEQMNTSTFYVFHHHPMFYSGFNSAYTSSNPSSSGSGFGGVGGVGGGFGGGGGGAR